MLDFKRVPGKASNLIIQCVNFFMVRFQPQNDEVNRIQYAEVLQRYMRVISIFIMQYRHKTGGNKSRLGPEGITGFDSNGN